MLLSLLSLLSNVIITIITIKNVDNTIITIKNDYRRIINNISKSEAINLLENFVLKNCGHI